MKTVKTYTSATFAIVTFSLALGINLIAACYDKAVNDPTDNNRTVLNDCTSIECQGNGTQLACSEEVRPQKKKCETVETETGNTCATTSKEVAWHLWIGDCKTVGSLCLCTDKQDMGEVRKERIDTCVCEACPQG